MLNEGKSGAFNVPDLCRKHGGGQRTHYKRKSKYGGMESSNLYTIRALEAENAKLKKMFADGSMQNVALKDILGQKL
ncbi:transposase [Paraglaciecola polaris]|uniref:transposase n=1 Tax=Paraglaciecola polaris TaxID=222814 RepID=UPI0009FCCC4E|nr:transposase [Paraglaciecola polaris]